MNEKIVKDFLNDTLKEVMSLTGAECGSLFLFDSGQKELVLKAFYNSKDLADLVGLKQRIGEGIAGKVLDANKAVLVKDIEADSRFSKNGFRHYRTNSFISIPLFSHNEILGLINLADKSTGAPFTENDFQVATTICKHACFTMEVIQKKVSLERFASVGKLAAGVVHEINNPLDGVIRYTNILLNQIENNSIAQEYLLEAKKGLNRIANITKSLLEFSRQINTLPTKVNRFEDLSRLIEESLEFLGDKANDGIHVHKRFKDKLPRIMDLGISHVVVNIIRNAFDAMPNGGILEVATDLKDAELEISFKDTGLGMSPEIKDKIFDPFFTTKSIDKGTGLGLAISKEIIAKYEGRIEVSSACGEGSTFTVAIPRKYLENVKP